MAISKTQNERPAIVALIDGFNLLESATQGQATQISELQGYLGNEIRARENADNIILGMIGTGFSEQLTIAQSLDSTNLAVENINEEIGNGFSSQNTVTGAVSYLSSSVTTLFENVGDVSNRIDALSNKLKIGLTEEITIPANGTYSGSYTYSTPFANNSKSIVMLDIANRTSQDDLQVTLTGCTYSGFSYSVSNGSNSQATVALGYISVKVN